MPHQAEAFHTMAGIIEPVPSFVRNKWMKTAREREARMQAGLWPCPRKALRGGISKVNFHQVCQLLTTISHKMAPRTGQSGAGITWVVRTPDVLHCRVLRRLLFRSFRF